MLKEWDPQWVEENVTILKDFVSIYKGNQAKLNKFLIIMVRYNDWKVKIINVGLRERCSTTCKAAGPWVARGGGASLHSVHLHGPEQWSFSSRCPLVGEVPGAVSAVGGAGHQISKSLYHHHCQDWHYSQWHWASVQGPLSLLQAFPHWLWTSEGLLWGTHTWMGCCVIIRETVSTHLQSNELGSFSALAPFNLYVQV